MKKLTMVVAGTFLALGGCVSSQDIIERTPTLSVANTNTEKATADCIASEIIRMGIRFNRARSDRENLTRFALEQPSPPIGIVDIEELFGIIEVSGKTVALKRNPMISVIGDTGLDDVMRQCAG
jgi:hypothetical protein